MLYSSDDRKAPAAAVDVVVNVKPPHAWASESSQQRSVKKNQSKKIKLDKCCRWTNIVGGGLNLAILGILAGAIINFGPEIPKAYNACSLAVSDIEKAIPLAKEIITDFPDLYNATKKAIDAFNEILPIVDTIPDLIEQVNKLIGEVANCTSAASAAQSNSEAVAQAQQNLMVFKKAFYGQARKVTESNQRLNTTLKKSSSTNRSYKVQPIKLGALIRSYQRGSRPHR